MVSANLTSELVGANISLLKVVRKKCGMPRNAGMDAEAHGMRGMTEAAVCGKCGSATEDKEVNGSI